MYKELAFDPACLSEMEYYRLIKQQVGLESGRYISVKLNSWVKEAMQNVKSSDLQPIKKQSIKNFLNTLRNKEQSKKRFVTPKDRAHIEANDWKSWVALQESFKRFDTIVSNRKFTNSIDINEIDDGHDSWSIKASISVPRIADDIVAALAQLVRLSKSLVIIDPYFKLSNNKTLLGLIRHECCCNLKKITVVSTITPLKPEAWIKNEAIFHQKNSMSIEWVVAPNGFFHDRYVITDLGALRSGHGFEEQSRKSAHSDYANINIISQDEMNRTLGDLEHLIFANKAKRNRIV